MKINAMISALLLSLLVSVQALADSSPEATLDAFHQAGVGANQTQFMALLAENAVFLGVEGNERLQGQSLRDYVSSSFASGNAWAYRSSDRDIRVSADGSVAWFDETLQHDQLGRGRASGVLVENGGSWKIAQYNLTAPLSDGATVSPAGASGTAAATEAPQKHHCTQLRHKTNQVSNC